MQDHPADKLHVKVAQANRADARFAHGGECFRQDFIQSRAFGRDEFFLRLLQVLFKHAPVFGIRGGAQLLAGRGYFCAWARGRVGEMRSEFVRLGAQVRIGQLLVFGFEPINLLNIRRQTLDFFFVWIAGQFRVQIFEHTRSSTFAEI